MNNKWFFCLILLLIFLALPMISKAQATATPDYHIDWWTIDGGGAISSTSGDFSLAGTIGQPEYGTSSAESYSLSGGFWGGGAAEIYRVILMLIFR